MYSGGIIHEKLLFVKYAFGIPTFFPGFEKDNDMNGSLRNGMLNMRFLLRIAMLVAAFAVCGSVYAGCAGLPEEAEGRGRETEKTVEATGEEAEGEIRQTEKTAAGLPEEAEGAGRESEKTADDIPAEADAESAGASSKADEAKTSAETDAESVSASAKADEEKAPAETDAENVSASAKADEAKPAAETDAESTGVLSKADEEKTPAEADARSASANANVEKHLAGMTLEQKVAQLFFITPEALTGADSVTMAGDMSRESYSRYPVGGLIYFENNIETREQTEEMLHNMIQISMEESGIPVFLGVDEEGGTVCRVSGRGIAGIPEMSSMLLVGQAGLAYEAGNEIGSYLSDLGFNVDFAPVADIYSNPENQVIADRAFGYDARTVSEEVSAFVEGMEKTGIRTTLKHFPGHGNTTDDSHDGAAVNGKNLQELQESELLPFRAGIEAGASFVMAGHISLPEVLGEDLPASLSPEVIDGLLRREMGFEGIVITDALNMGAISQQYASGPAAAMALLAGCDMILMPADFHEAYQYVLNAADTGLIPEERIDESVRRILKVKEKLGQSS